ncbi:MAG: host attachment protein [Hyphomicrobiales bacterium]|nr:host attachment protein [Hyphomicrobiales bacterium]
MSEMKFNTGDWILVCDGAKSLLLHNKGDEKFPNFETLSTREQENPKTANQGTNPPGRVHSSSSTERSAVEQTDWHDRAEQEFLTGVVQDLNHAVEQGKVQAITIVAAPRALGMMRPHYSKGLSALLANEIAKDYAGKPVHEIETLLTGK